MDMVERRIREVLATLLSKGAKALERTAGELEQAASELRREAEPERVDAERVWDEEPIRAPDRMVRSAPLRAVPDTPTGEAPEEVGSVVTPVNAPWTPPAEHPRTPERGRSGDVDAAVTTSMTVAGLPEEDATPDRIQQIAGGTVSQVRAQLDDLSADELRGLREVEAANRNRTTLLSAIDRALATAQ